jgi:hypothetical protein
LTTDEERRALRADILSDVGALLHEELAAEAWGRILVEVVRGPDGSPQVAGIDVEEVLGDDSRVDVFDGDRARGLLPVLAKAVEALCALDGVELEDVAGGTFVRRPDGAFAWLASLVHAPSARFDRERDAVLERMAAKNRTLADRFGFPEGGQMAIDLQRETLDFAGPGGKLSGRATLIGTFAPAGRSWGWGGTNPHLPEDIRRSSSALVDAVLDRDAWELSTPAFATDLGTAWALAAFVCDHDRGDGVVAMPEGGGLVFVLLRDLREPGSSAQRG